MLKVIPPVPTGFSTPRQTRLFNQGYDQKSCGEYSKVDKLVLVTMSYEGSNYEEELQTVSVRNNNIDVVSDSKSDGDNQK